MTTLSPRLDRAGVFDPDAIDELALFYRQQGFAILSGAVTEAALQQLEAECVAAQEALVAGRLDEGYGSAELVEADAGARLQQFANYVLRITELSPIALEIVHSPLVTDVMMDCLGPDCWSGGGDRFGYVYQDARPSAESSYKRIGWHSDWQSGPHLAVWPATAITIHIDGTGPANGFLRVVPGSHLWATDAPYENVNGAVVPAGAAPRGGYTATRPPQPMPLRFDNIPGEVAVYVDRGDLLFHDCYLWHSAALATDPDARRRHVRGSWYAGSRPGRLGPADFVKNAAR